MVAEPSSPARPAGTGTRAPALPHRPLSVPLYRPDRPLPATSVEHRIPPSLLGTMEAASQTDLSGVRAYEGPAAPVLGAAALAIGSELHFAPGYFQPGNTAGQQLIAHELAHVVQQNQAQVPRQGRVGRLALNRDTSLERQADAMASEALSSPPRARDGASGSRSEALPAPRSAGLPPVVQRRDKKFAPFAIAMDQKDVTIAGLKLDELIEDGLQYARGGTKGNALNLEKMVSNGGGGSDPGEPADFFAIREIDAGLVRARGQENAATAMHAINHNFTDNDKTNRRAENIFMGSASSNTDLHFYKVENPIRQAMQSARAGNAKKYEDGIRANPGKPLDSDNDVLAWSKADLDIPGTKKLAQPLSTEASKPLAGRATHTLKKSDLADVTKPWPKVIQYRVVPKYTYQAWPNFPQFLKDNIATAQELVDEANKQPTPRANQAQIDNEVAAIQRLKDVGDNLFPEDFTCAATYWFPTYEAKEPWKVGSEDDIYSAEN